MTIDLASLQFLTGLVIGAGIGLLAASAVTYIRGPREVYVSHEPRAVIEMTKDGVPAMLIQSEDER